MRFSKALICCIVAVSTQAIGQDRSALSPSDLPPTNGYSHVVVAPQGRRVVISGQVALDSEGNLVGKDDFEKQCIQVHENIAKALASVGLTFKDVIRTDNYITDRKYLPLLRKVRANYIAKDSPPTSTLLIVDGPISPGAAGRGLRRGHSSRRASEGALTIHSADSIRLNSVLHARGDPLLSDFAARAEHLTQDKGFHIFRNGGDGERRIVVCAIDE
jgi:enamine deaminase RidA (YjgF/YER057c/UK114 family)